MSDRWQACASAGFRSGVKLYGPLFVITTILSSRFRPSPEVLVTKTLPSVLRSASFLGVNAGLFPFFMCMLLRYVGPHSKFKWFLGSFGAGFLAILIEKAGRRTELAVYMMSQAAEALYKALAARGVLPAVSFGAEILYSLSFATLVLFLRTRPELVPGSCRGATRALTDIVFPSSHLLPFNGSAAKRSRWQRGETRCGGEAHCQTWWQMARPRRRPRPRILLQRCAFHHRSENAIFLN